MATASQVQALYVGYLGRAADQAGLKFWTDAINAGTSTIESVALGFTLSPEYQAKYAGLDSAGLVDAIYKNVLGRTADADGKAFWVGELAKGAATPDTLLAKMINSLGTVDQQVVNNKVFVAQTYTDTVGAGYNAEAGASVISGVTNDSATVTAALNQISTGTLNGQVVGLELINALAAANAAVATYETANQAAVDALAKTLKVAVAPGTSFDAELNGPVGVAKAAQGARDLVSTESTAVLATKADDAAKTVADAYAALSSTEKVQADKYVAAVAAEATAKAGAATATEQGSAIGGLDSDATAKTALQSHTSASALYDEYVAATAAQRTAIDTEFKDSSFYATFKATVAKDAAYADAVKATLAAKDALDAGTVASTTTVQIHGVTVVGNADATDGSSAADTYVNDLAAKTLADTTLADAKAADANVVAVKALVDGYATLTKAAGVADDAIFKAVTGFNATHTDAKIIALNANQIGSDTVKETFFFAEKTVAADTHSDFTISKFGAGDSIALGSEYTFNKGALSAGDNNKLEFFLVQNGNDTLAVLETAKYGSADVAVNNGVVNAFSVADHAAIITLTGVNVADLTVNNGVISHV